MRYVPYENAVHNGRVYFAIGKCSFGSLNSQIRAGEIFELAAESAESSALGSYNKYCSLRKI